MRRNLDVLAREHFDLVVVGGGIYGACVAREAALRGLRVALVEKEDFGGATSAVSQRIIHGGLRYLQHADVARSRESVREQRTLLRIAPHLVRPLPVLVPAYGHGLAGREALAVGAQLARLVAIGCDRPSSSHTRLPPPRLLSRGEALGMAPALAETGLTGGLVFYDAQVERSERLLVAFLQAAAENGAELANHVEVRGFLRRSDRVEGVVAEDRLGAGRLEIRARVVVNAAGPWIARVIGLGGASPPALPLARGLNLVINRPLFGDRLAVGFYAADGYRDRDALLHRGRRLLFATPWRGRSIVGTAFAPHRGDPEDAGAHGEEVDAFLDSVNRGCPALALRAEDVAVALAGLVPSEGGAERGDVRVSKHSRIVDHARHGEPGLLSIVGVKYTTARNVAERAVGEVFRILGRSPPALATATMPLCGGEIENLAAFAAAAIARHSEQWPSDAIERLTAVYGTGYEAVLGCVEPADAGEPAETRLLRAEVRHAVRREMAQTLDDCLRLRTGHAAAGHPGDDVARIAAAVMAETLDWSPERTAREIASFDGGTWGERPAPP